MLESEIVFSIEAWLPGKLVFPSLSVLFLEEITTEEFSLNVVSAFDEDVSEKKLSSIILPNEKSNKWLFIILFVILFIFVVFAAFLIIKKYRGKRVVMPKKTK